VNYIKGNGGYVTDIIPVDYVTNSIIVSTALYAMTKKPDL